MKAVLSIAGSDSSGGAGIQADIKTIAAHGLYAETVITALTAQNTLGVFGVQEATAESVSQQLDAVFDDIVPDAVKIGMISSPLLIDEIVAALKKYRATHIVVDPVMVSTSRHQLVSNEAIAYLKEHLLPLAELITPNIPEAELLSGRSIANEDDMQKAATILGEQYDGAVLIKGGHLKESAVDLLVTPDGECKRFYAEHIDTKNTHGTGCTLSSALACNLALGYSLQDAVARAKDYITGALKHNLGLGRGYGPLNHMWRFEGRF